MTQYLLGTLELAVIVAALYFAASRLRRALLPGYTGTPALVGTSVIGIALAIVLAEIVGTFGAFTDVGYLIAVAAAAALSPAAASRIARATGADREPRPPAPEQTGFGVPLVAICCAAVFAAWAIPTLTSIAGGMGRADTLWYHMPFANRFVQTGSTGNLDFVDPIFFAHFYPANSELLHAIPILAYGRDSLSPLLNLAFLALGFTSAWAVGRPFGVGPQALLGASCALGAQMLSDFQPGEALNDIVGVSFMLAGVAILVNAHAARGEGSRSIGWGAIAVAGLSAGLAAGTKPSFLIPVALLAIGVLAVAPRGARIRTTSLFSGMALVGGGYWFARNLVQVGNPFPLSPFGPLHLPSPPRNFELRDPYSIAHYFTDGSIWKDWFIPGLHDALGLLWPLTVLGVFAGGAYALWKGKEPILRALGGMALVSAIAYLFTPLTAAGEPGEPIAFVWNVRYIAPGAAIALAVLPCLPYFRATARRRTISLIVLALLAGVTIASVQQWNLGHAPGAVATALLVLGLFGAWSFARSRALIGPAARPRTILVLTALGAIVVVGSGFAEQRHYLEGRYSNLSPQLGLAGTVRWARDLRDARIAVSGVRGVFNQYAFYGTDVSNHVQWLGKEGADGAYNRIGDCSDWRQAVNQGDFDYVVTMYDPYEPGRLTDTKEALWTRLDPNAKQVMRDGPVSVFEIKGPLDPSSCGDLPTLDPSELDGDSVNLDVDANQPYPKDLLPKSAVPSDDSEEDTPR
ncbi:hypothetical protein BH10ACT11_BH10ACT11_07900 [soil metagenome]